jgi:integrase
MYRRKRKGKSVGPWWYWDPIENRRVSSGTTDKERAKAMLRAREDEAHDRQTGRYVPRWEERAETWLELHRHLGGIRSQEDYHNFWLEHLTGKRLNEIDEELVHTIILRERPGVSTKQRVPANSTANLYVQFVGKILRFGKVTPPTFYRYPPPKGSRGWLRPEQWVTLHAALPVNARRVCTFALATGLRIENVLRFRWAWLHDDRAYLPAEVTKTAEAYGIPLNASAAAVIAEVRRDVVRHPELVFTHMGQPWKYHTLLHALKTAAARTDLGNVTPHVLRHSFASWLTQQGVADSIRRRLGCWQAASGADAGYQHFDVEWLRPFAARLDPLICPAFVTQQAKNADKS